MSFMLFVDCVTVQRNLLLVDRLLVLSALQKSGQQKSVCECVCVCVCGCVGMCVSLDRSLSCLYV